MEKNFNLVDYSQYTDKPKQYKYVCMSYESQKGIKNHEIIGTKRGIKLIDTYETKKEAKVYVDKHTNTDVININKINKIPKEYYCTDSFLDQIKENDWNYAKYIDGY